MPLKPIHKHLGTPKKFEDFSTDERISWITATRREIGGGVFGVAGPIGLVDVVNVKRCLAFYDGLSDAEKQDGELQGSIADLRDLLERTPERPATRARA